MEYITRRGKGGGEPGQRRGVEAGQSRFEGSPATRVRLEGSRKLESLVHDALAPNASWPSILHFRRQYWSTIVPHINHRRGETRTFVVRREGRRSNLNRGPNILGIPRIRRIRGRKGLGKRYMVLARFGLRNWCPCCQPMGLHHHNGIQDRITRRYVNRLDRREGKRQCREWVEEEGADQVYP